MEDRQLEILVDVLKVNLLFLYIKIFVECILDVPIMDFTPNILEKILSRTWLMLTLYEWRCLEVTDPCVYWSDIFSYLYYRSNNKQSCTLTMDRELLSDGCLSHISAFYLTPVISAIYTECQFSVKTWMIWFFRHKVMCLYVRFRGLASPCVGLSKNVMH